jgi:hypothetical protein
MQYMYIHIHQVCHTFNAICTVHTRPAAPSMQYAHQNIPGCYTFDVICTYIPGLLVQFQCNKYIYVLYIRPVTPSAQYVHTHQACYTFNAICT